VGVRVATRQPVEFVDGPAAALFTSAMPFLDEDVVVRQSGVDHFELVQPVRYHAGGRVFTVPAVRAGGFLRGSGPLELLRWLLIAIPALVFLAVAALAIVVWLALFYVVELLAWPFTGWRKPAPEFTIRTQ